LEQYFVDVLQSPFNTDLDQSIAALIFLVVFAVIGSGRWSLEKIPGEFGD